MDDTENNELAQKWYSQQQSTDGRMQMHDGMNVVNSLSIAMMGLKVCVSRFVFVASVE